MFDAHPIKFESNRTRNSNPNSNQTAITIAIATKLLRSSHELNGHLVTIIIQNCIHTVQFASFSCYAENYAIDGEWGRSKHVVTVWSFNISSIWLYAHCTTLTEKCVCQLYNRSIVADAVSGAIRCGCVKTRTRWIALRLPGHGHFFLLLVGHFYLLPWCIHSRNSTHNFVPFRPALIVKLLKCSQIWNVFDIPSNSLSI